MTEKKSLKRRGEDAASAFLEQVGICVIERNWRCDAGTVDIVAWDGDVLVLVDVKTIRSGKPSGTPAASAATARRIYRLAKAYMDSAGLENIAWRLDRVQLLVVSEDRALLRHHRDALTHTQSA